MSEGEFESFYYVEEVEKDEKSNNNSYKNANEKNSPVKTLKSNFEENKNEIIDKIELKKSQKIKGKTEENINIFYNKSNSQKISGEKENVSNLKNILSNGEINNNENINKNTIINNNSKNQEINNNINDENEPSDDSFLDEKNEEKIIEKKEDNKIKIQQKKCNENKNDNPILKRTEKKEEFVLKEAQDEAYKEYFQDDKEIKKTRFSNMGNFSFLNSILRCIGNIEDLKNYFIDKKEMINIYKSIREEKEEQKQQRLSFAIQRLFWHIYNDTKQEKYLPDKIQRVLAEKIILYEEKNNIELEPGICLNFILNQIHDELNSKKDKNEQYINSEQNNMEDVIEKGTKNFLNNNDSIISKTFVWHELININCNKCKSNKFLFQSFFTFDLDIPNFYRERKRNGISIYEYLGFVASKKRISNFYCNKCKTLSEGKYNKRINNSPKIFAFILDRENFNPNLMEMNFNIDEDINMEPFIENSQLQFFEYELIGIVSIIGKKYVSFTKDEDGSWFAFDNSNIKKIGKKEIINSNENSDSTIKHIPCVLFYKLKENK